MINKIYYDKLSRRKIKLLYLSADNYSGYGMTEDGKIINVLLENLEETSDEQKAIEQKFLDEIINSLLEIERMQNLIDNDQEIIKNSLNDTNMIKR